MNIDEQNGRRRGRGSRGGGEARRTRRVAILLTEAEHRALDAAARADDRSMSTLARRYVLEGLARRKGRGRRR